MDHGLCVGHRIAWVFLMGVLMLTSCQVDRRVAEGRFQKRKFNKGWHLDLHQGSGQGILNPRTSVSRHSEEIAELPDPSEDAKALRKHPSLTTLIAGSANAHTNLHAGTVSERGMEPLRETVAGGAPRASVADHVHTQVRPIKNGSSRDTGQEELEDDEKGDMEPMAMLGFIAFLGGFAMALTGLFPFAMALWVLALTFSIAALVRIHAVGTRGKGFAIATLLLLVALVILMVAVARSMSFSL